MDKLWYDVTYSDAFQSAVTGIPFLEKEIRPETVADVGGGHGAWAKAWESLYGVSATVFDMDTVPDRLRHDPFIEVDLTQEGALGTGYFDVALCLEVGEHLPPEAARTLVASLGSITNRVVFSAAQPGQEGPGHINLQPPSYWAKLFQVEGFTADHEWPRQRWQAVAPSMEPWYLQNVTYYTRPPR